MRGIRFAGRVFSVLLTTVLAFLLACNLYLIGVRHVTGQLQPTVFGYSSAVVISGSMADAINVNDMVITHRQADYSVGDVITFESGSVVVTHRIMEKSDEGFTTKGDANNAADQETVSLENIIGRVVLVIPGIGLLIEYMRTPLGMLCLVLVGFLLVELSIHLNDRRENEQGGKSDDQVQ